MLYIYTCASYHYQLLFFCSLCSDDVSRENVIPLSYLKFQNVHHLTVSSPPSRLALVEDIAFIHICLFFALLQCDRILMCLVY